MGTWQVRAAVGVLAAAGWAAAWPATGTTEENAPAKAPAGADATKADEAAALKIEKYLAGIEERLKDLQADSGQVSMAEVAAQGAAKGQDVVKIQQELEKGSKKPEHLQYRAAVEAVAGQYRALAEKCARIVNMTKALDRDREKAPPEVQARIDAVSKLAADKYRSLLEKVAELYDKCADAKNALAAYQSIYQMTPEAKRDRPMKQKLADLCKKAGDARNAAAMYKAILESIPENERYKDRKFVEDAAAACKDAGDLRTALLLYKALWDAIPEKDRAKDWALGEKLADLCEKAGDHRSALQVYQMCYDAMSDTDKKDKKKGVPLKAKIQLLRVKLGMPPLIPAA
jgi:hypothetical protein